MKKFLPFLIFILYWILFPSEVGEEFAPILLSSAEVPGDITAIGGNPVLSFSAPGNCGYIDENGDIIFSLANSSFVSTAGGYTLALEDNGKYSIRDLKNNIIADVDIDGYPIYMDAGLFVLSPDYRELSIYSKGGMFMVSRYFPTPVSSLDAGCGLIAVGLTNGDIHILDAKGSTVFNSKLNYSGLSCVYAVKIGRDGNKIAVIHGNKPQFLHIFSKRTSKAGDYADYYVAELNSDFFDNVFLQFSGNGKVVAYQTGDGLEALNIDKPGIINIRPQGIFRDGILSEDGLFFFMSLERDGKCYMSYMDLNGGEMYSSGSPADYISFSISSRLLLAYARNIDAADEGFSGNIENMIYLYGLLTQ